MSNAREKQSWTALLVTMTKQTSPTERRSFKKCQQASATPKKHRLTSTCARCFHKEKARGKAEIKSQNHISNGGEKQYNEHCMKCFNKTEQNWPTEGKSILGNANRHEQHPRSIDWPLDAEGVFTRGKEKQGWNVSLKSLLSNLGFAWKPTWSKLYQIYASKRSQWTFMEICKIWESSTFAAWYSEISASKLTKAARQPNESAQEMIQSAGILWVNLTWQNRLMGWYFGAFLEEKIADFWPRLALMII